MTSELATRRGVTDIVEAGELTIETLKRRTNLVEDIKAELMIPREDYGLIPGCGTKPSLLQPGAQRLATLFGLVPRIEEETETSGPGDHLTVRMKIRMVHVGTGSELADGVGMCTTLESRYRYRKTERKCPHCNKAAISAAKPEYNEGRPGWFCWKKKDGCGATFAVDDPKIVSQAAGKVEYEDPADYWNTARKIAFKRGMVHAVLNSIGGSGSFTQDIEDSPGVFGSQANGAPAQAAKPPLQRPQAKAAQQAAPQQGQPDPGVISEPQRKRLFGIAKQCGVSHDELAAYLKKNLGDESTARIRREDYKDVVDWVQANAQAGV